jgi:hypothetical protein
VLFEPAFDLKTLGWGWSFLFAGFAVLCGAVALMSANGAAATVQESHAASKPTTTRQLLWLALSAMGSVMLLAVTNHITQNVASVPFLWVVPLALYLVTFILAFDHPRWYVRPLFLALLIVLAPAMAWYAPSLELRVAMPIYVAGLFVSCMFCHGELAALKPDPAHLTRFYLMISLGGALGAVLVAIVAPLVLTGYFELGIALVLLALLLSTRLRGFAVLGGLAVTVTPACWWCARRRTTPRACASWSATSTAWCAPPTIRRRSPYRSMYHGSIMHGGQLLGDSFRNVPPTTSDRARATAAYSLLREMQPKRKLSVGVIGLGAGVIASWMKPGDALVFYEISPRVVDIAKREFTFLHDTAARTELVMGDGRLSLEREPPRGYDVMGIDAFSGDSIPMHLVTREAMALYVKHLKPDGVIVFQATNRFIDLLPVVKRLAAEFGSRRSTLPIAGIGRRPGYWYSPTDQVIVTRNAKLLAWPRIADARRRDRRSQIPARRSPTRTTICCAS